MSIVQSIVGIVVASVNSQTTVYNNRQRVRSTVSDRVQRTPEGLMSSGRIIA